MKELNSAIAIIWHTVLSVFLILQANEWHSQVHASGHDDGHSESKRKDQDHFLQWLKKGKSDLP